MADETGLTTEGYDALRSNDYLEIIREDFESRYDGEPPDWDRDEPLGVLTAVIADRLGQLSEASQALYDARNPNNARGASLDALLASQNLTRSPATPSVVIQRLVGDVDTVVDSTRSVIGGGPDGSLEWRITRDVVIGYEIDVTAFSAGEEYAVTINGTTVSYTAQTGDTAADVYVALRKEINGAPGTGGVDAYTFAIGAADVNTLTVEGTGQSYAISVTATGTASIGLTAGRAYVVVEATEPGEFSAEPNTVETIGKGSDGWDSTTNPARAQVGTDVESNREARRRFFRSQQLSGNGTKRSVLARLLDLEFVQNAAVVENDERTDQTIDGIQIEGNSMLVIVFPNTLTQEQKTTIAELIWESKTLGTKTLGTDVQALVTARDGQTHEVNYDFANEQLLDVRTTVTLDDSAEVSDVSGPIRREIAEYFDEDLLVGDDVRRLEIYARIATIEGVVRVDDLEFRPPGGAYFSGDVTINGRTFAAIRDQTVLG